MFIRKRILALAGASALGAGTVLAVAAGPVQATTGTCLGTQNPVSGPVSCGGLFLPGMGPAPSTTVGAASLTLTAASDFWNAPITFAPYSATAKTQDFTLYERCKVTPASPTDALPCGSTANTVYNAASNQPEFVAEVTPLGHHLGGAINTAGNLCISFETQHVGPMHRPRHVLVERTCDTYGAVFTAPVDDGNVPAGCSPGGPTFCGTGISGTVESPNLFQTFASISTGAGLGGNIIANDVLSNNFHNVLYVVDDQGLGYPTGRAILYPENDQKNQVSEFIGCNGAVIVNGVANDCP
jgi:hypothetical protein